MVVIGVINAFVYAHNHHRRNLDISGNFRDCMEGRIRLMKAMRTSPFAWLDACLSFLATSFACRLSKPDVRIFLALEPQHVFLKATIFKDGPFTQMEELVSLRAKPQLVGAPSPTLLR